MLTAITGLLNNRRDRQAMLDLRCRMDGIHALIFPKDEMTGALARMKTGLHLTKRLETRFGIMGPDFLDTVYTDDDLERHGEIIDKWHPDFLVQLSAELARQAGRTILERGDPDTWADGEDTANVAHLLALRFLSGWLKCKSIVHSSMNTTVIREARELEDLHYCHIQSLLRIFRGEASNFGEKSE